MLDYEFHNGDLTCPWNLNDQQSSCRLRLLISDHALVHFIVEAVMELDVEGIYHRISKQLAGFGP